MRGWRAPQSGLTSIEADIGQRTFGAGLGSAGQNWLELGAPGMLTKP